MRFWLRALVIVAGIFATFFALPGFLTQLGLPWGVAIVLTLIVVVGGGNWLLYAALRCPRCQKWAGRLPDGHTTAWPGLRCRYCQAPY